jgi:peptidoglycan/LPS O-acetylase OafA/YrhL
MNNYRFDGIQALRFLAAIMVVFTHSTFYASERLGGGYFS